MYHLLMKNHVLKMFLTLNIFQLNMKVFHIAIKSLLNNVMLNLLLYLLSTYNQCLQWVQQQNNRFLFYLIILLLIVIILLKIHIRIFNLLKIILPFKLILTFEKTIQKHKKRIKFFKFYFSILLYNNILLWFESLLFLVFFYI